MTRAPESRSSGILSLGAWFLRPAPEPRPGRRNLTKRRTSTRRPCGCLRSRHGSIRNRPGLVRVTFCLVDAPTVIGGRKLSFVVVSGVLSVGRRTRPLTSAGWGAGCQRFVKSQAWVISSSLFRKTSGLSTVILSDSVGLGVKSGASCSLMGSSVVSVVGIGEATRAPVIILT